MNPVLGPGYHPQVPSQSYTLYENHTDSLTSPSPSTHFVRPPPPQPAYPTLNHPQQNGWVFPPNYFPPQPRYSHPPFYPNGNGQMGGPGPGTMRNGYRAFQPDGYSPPFGQNGYTQASQGYLSPPDSNRPIDDAPPKSGFPMGNQSLPQQSMPPQMLDGYHRGPNYTPLPNGHAPPPAPQSSFQSFYPPDHPYAHGDGFGYSPFPPGPDMAYGNGYGSYADGNASLPMMPPQVLPGNKSLNPAAQGFSFTPLQGGPAGPEDADRPSVRPDEMPVFASIQPQHSTPVAANGRPDSTSQDWPAGIMVDGEKLEGIDERRQSGDSDQGAGVIGLTHLIQADATAPSPPDLPAIPPSVSVPATMTQSVSTPAMSTSATTPTTPASLQTPRITNDAENAFVPVLEAAIRVQPDGTGWSFVGPSMSGSMSSASNGTATVAPSATPSRSVSSSVPRRRVPVSTETAPLKLRPSRPGADSTSENAYDSSLSIAIPKAIRTEKVAVNEDVPRSSTKCKGKASGKRVIFAIGMDDEDQAKMGVERRAGSALVFGSLAEGLRASPSPSPSAVIASSPIVSAPKTELTPSIPLAPSKPTSWASLFNGTGKTLARSPSIPSSMVVSPSKSAMSLATDSEAAPSRMSTEPTTPRSTAPTLLPSTGASAASAPRPVFNYAAAAAAGANLTPQEELAKLLTDGLRDRHKESPMCLPRGLINTGNMCFANTVRLSKRRLLYANPSADLASPRVLSTIHRSSGRAQQTSESRSFGPYPVA